MAKKIDKRKVKVRNATAASLYRSDSPFKEKTHKNKTGKGKVPYTRHPKHKGNPNG